MPGLGATELIIILVLILLLFGASRLPKLARSVGQASREFKEGVGEGTAETEAKYKKRDDGADATVRADRPARSGGGLGEEKVTLSKAELDALLAEREARAREERPPSS